MGEGGRAAPPATVTLDVREISITLTDRDFGEEKAHAREIAWLRQSIPVRYSAKVSDLAKVC